MRLIRALLVLLVAVAVTTVPIAGGCGVFTKLATAASALSEPCPQYNHNGTDQPAKPDDASCMIGCAAKCFGYARVAVPAGPSAPIEAVLKPLVTIDAVASQTRLPPFRPPRL